MSGEISQQIEQEFAYVDSIITAHSNAAIAKINTESLQMYWEVGEYISRHLRTSEWGDHIVSELADYLKRKSAKRRGYSKRNLYNMVRFFDTYSSRDFVLLSEQLKLDEFVQLGTAQIGSTEFVQFSTAQLQPTSMPQILCLTTFTNHIEIINRCKSYEEYVFYILYAAHNHLKNEELRHCIVSQTYANLMSKGKMMNPALKNQYPCAEYMLKDQVLLDFLNLKEKHTEPQLHTSLLENMKRFILELGKGDFLYVDQEFAVMVGNKRKRIDLVFYHRDLQCLVAVELKAIDYEAEFASKMDMYLEALDRDFKKPNENPSVGIILCPSADRAEVEYSINRTMSPTMVAEYKRVLVPREVIKKSLVEYCEFLKEQYG